MRLLIAMMKHETNTFSPVPTPLARFGIGRTALRRGGDPRLSRHRDRLGAYLDLAERERADIVLLIAAGASPSGLAEDTAYKHITDTICTRLPTAASTASCSTCTAPWSPRAWRTARASS
jgi:microcystin degradation protein MlrC